MLLNAAPRSAEFSVLCSVARPRADYSQIATALRGDIEWPTLLSLAGAHGVRPQLIRAFRELDWMYVSSHAKRSLLEFLRLHKMRNLFLAGELFRVSDRLSQRAIQFATFKGPSLAAALYGDLSLREFNDIDIIVEEQRLPEVEAVLSSLDYRPVHGSSAFRGSFLSYQRQFAFVRDAPRTSIDLHWDFTASYTPFPISAAEIWNNLEEVDIAGRSVPTLGRNDLALFLAGHGTKEGWRCLGWVADFAMFIEKHHDLDWDHLLDRAQRRGCGRAFLLGCQLAARLLGTRVKADLLKLPEKTLTTESVVRRIRDGLPAPSLDRHLGDLELCETRLRKARAIAKLLVTRTVGDYLSMPLPRSLWRVYHVTRPFRLAAKTITNLARIGSSQRGKELPSRAPVPNHYRGAIGS